MNKIQINTLSWSTTDTNQHFTMNKAVILETLYYV